MKIFWCCLLAALLVVCRAAVDVEKTVKQVQSILQANQQLPRLTRDEIIQLLNDIRKEDAKSADLKKFKEDNKENVTKTTYLLKQQSIEDNLVSDDQHSIVSSSVPTFIETTTKKQPTLMVVLPYTPRDGSSLQELYTRPPRTEVVKIYTTTTSTPKTVRPSQKPKNTMIPNVNLANQNKDDIPAELKAFLDSHGLKGTPGQDNFLLPLEGFKPLPPAKIVDGEVQLPENILLTYDLISPIDAKTNHDGSQYKSPNNFLYEPLRPELPFELDSASSEIKEVKFPYDMPSRKTKSISSSNFEPIDYDSVKVIPLQKNSNLNPINEEVNGNNEQNKRQIFIETTTTAAEKESEATTTTTTTTEEPKTNAEDDSVQADSDAGASIADLEDSFGGAAPSQPGDSELPPPRKNGFYWMLDWNSFLEVGDGDTKVNIRFEPKLGDHQMFLPVNVP